MSGNIWSGRESFRKIRAGTLANMLATVVSMLTPLLAMPMLLRYIGDTNFGYWMSAVALSSLAFFLDFGIGGALLTKISQLRSNGYQLSVKRYISSAYFFSLASSFALLIVFITILMLGSERTVVSGSKGIWILVIGLTCINFPVSLIQSVMNAYHKEIELGLWRSFGALCSVVVCYLCINAQLDWLVVLGAYLFVLPIVMILAAIVFFKNNEAIRPAVSSLRRGVVKSLVGSAKHFTVLSILLALSSSADVLIINSYLGAEAVAEYSVPAKLASLMSLILLATCTPLWTAYSVALRHGDKAWVQRNCRQVAFVFGLLALLFALVMFLWADRIIGLWMNRPFAYQTELAVGLSVLYFCQAITAPYNMVLNSQNIVSFQTALWILCLTFTGAAKIWAVSSYPVYWLPWIGALFYVVFISIPVVYYSKKWVLGEKA